MTIECPVCGHEVSVTQYSFDEDMCYDCYTRLEKELDDKEEN